MVQKRPFDAEEILEFSFKHPKQMGPSNQLVSFSESVLPEDACNNKIPKTSEVECRGGGSEGNEKLAGDTFAELPRGSEDYETGFPVGISVSLATSSTSEEDVPLEPLVYLPFFPGYLSPERPIRTLARYEDIYSTLLEHPPRKLVSIGANHQADMPGWDRPNASDTVSDSDYDVGHEFEKRFMGACIIPMPQIDLSSFDNEEVGKGRTDCSCEDRGSMRCVRQHIVEAREDLMKTFGHERFTDLGLSDMGEQVAEKWSTEEEQLFHEVVFNNPASLGKNFWNYLSIVFPSRTKKEMVSYYFNVFMLQRRAEQNRNGLLNIDSDNDEWPGGDGNDIATHEEDEESVVESPICQDDTCFTDCHENEVEDYDEYVADEDDTYADIGTVDYTERNSGNDTRNDTEKMHHCSCTPLIQPLGQPVQQDPRDGKIKDDSCTASDTGVASQETKLKTENGDHWCGNYNGVSNGYSQGYVLEPCDAQVWDSSFVSCSKNKIDFLPTCNMIEEVFGDGRRQEMRRA